MKVPISVLFLALLQEISKLRADLRKADQLSIQLENERDWHKGRYELLAASLKAKSKN